jgi:hypothetical protein
MTSSNQGSGLAWNPAALLEHRRASELQRRVVAEGGSSPHGHPTFAANGTDISIDFQFSTPEDPFAEKSVESTYTVAPAGSARTPTTNVNGDDDIIIVSDNTFGSMPPANGASPGAVDPSYTTPQPNGTRSQNGTPVTRPTIGQGGMIERMAQAEDRPIEPALKRRKVDGAEPALKETKWPLGNGVLSDFATQKSQETQVKGPSSSKQLVDLTGGMAHFRFDVFSLQALLVLRVRTLIHYGR